jgi:hypothetical protein
VRISRTILAAACAAATPTASAAPNVCLPKSAKDSAVAAVVYDGKRVAACYGGGDGVGDEPSRACVVIEPATGAVVGRTTWKAVMAAYTPPQPPTSRFEIATTSDRVTICSTGLKDCSTLRPVAAPLPAGLQLVTAVNGDGTRAFVLVPEAIVGRSDKWRVFGDSYELASGKRVGRVQLTGILGAKQPVFDEVKDRQWTARFVGSAVQVADLANGPDGTVFLVDPASGKAVLVQRYNGRSIPAGTDAMLAIDGKQARLIDIKKLDAIVSVTAPGKPLANADHELGLDGVLAGDKIVLASANPPHAIVVDVAKRSAGAAKSIAICK